MNKKPERNRRSFPVRTIQAVLGGRPLSLDGAPKDEVFTPGPLRALFHVLHLLLVGIHRTHLTRMAAAMAYRTMFGLIPAIVIVAVGLASFTSEKTQRDVIKQMLGYAGLNTLKFELPAIAAQNQAERDFVGPPAPANGSTGQDPEPGGTSTGATPTTTPTASDPSAGPSGEAARTAETLDKWINDRAIEIAGKIKQIPVGPIGVIAILALVYAAISMLVEVEQAFNDIYNAPEGRSWVRRIVQYWTLLTLGPILLIASFSMTVYFKGSAETIAGIGGESFRATLLAILGFLGTAFVSTVLLFVIYTTVPNTRVQIAPAFLGAVVAGVLWETGKQGFTKYVEFATRAGPSTNYGNLYGALAILPLFLIWVYVSWLIVLFGLQLAYSMQTYRQATARGLTRSVLATLGLIESVHASGRPKLVDPSAIVSVLACVAGRFRLGEPSDHNQVAQCIGIDEQAVGEMLEKLTTAGLLVRVVGGPERLSTYSLAKPPESIPAQDVLLLGEDLAGPKPPADAPPPVIGLVDRARREALEGKSIADLVPPNAAPSANGPESPSGPISSQVPPRPAPAVG